ncbi:Dehydrogenase [Planctomycetales bacterium 10988]|nr:Dehydrogenase [Planctomycetales bacterium 10988]
MSQFYTLLTSPTSVISGIFVSCLFSILVGLGQAEEPQTNLTWETKKLDSLFYAEGAAAGDINGDGQTDLVSGPFWWKGPAFEEKFSYYPPRAFDINGYSDHFFTYVMDFNQDERQDILVLGFPGREARLYLNPGENLESEHSEWSVHMIADQVSNESPSLVDLISGGFPEIVCSRDQAYGYFQAGDDATKPWQWHAISETGVTVKRFGHGLGVGDINGDGRLDVIERYHWWEHPADDQNDRVWKKHLWNESKSGRGGAQILVQDVDGDGLNDLITSRDAHGYGFAWHRQVKRGKDRRGFLVHRIMGNSSVLNPYGVVFSQLHGLASADLNGDGKLDLITGKRWKAHNGKDPGSHQPAVVYWFEATERDGEVEFVPHLIDEDSGIGVGVLVADLNGDDLLDVVSSNKKGTAIHFQQRPHAETAVVDPPQRWQPLEKQNLDSYANGLEPEDAIARMQVLPGFHVDLIASEPDVVQPIAMCFDARGRIWVVEGNTYPQRVEDGAGKDRILIFEDTDHDGTFETRKVFLDQLNLVSGIEVGFGGVWVGAAPYLLFVPDENQDDVPDSDPVVLLDGWGYEDTHETLNSFTWGPDGWLYGCHGVFTHSRVGKPGTPDAERVPLNAGIWRYHPTRHTFEVFAWGTSNPWGVDFNDEGDFFLTCCVIPHLFHVVQGARYHRQAGPHFSPYIYEDIPTIADHLHYGDGTFASMGALGRVDRGLVSRTADQTSDVGGGHAHCGLAIYLGDQYPPEYYGDLFFNNLHGHRIVREAVERDGSGFVGRHRPDFAFAQDNAYVGVGVMLGPDGALYLSDWHDLQTCHHRDVNIWNRTNGRIYRVRYGDEKRTPAMNLWVESDEVLISYLKHKNAFYVRQSQRILQERAAQGTLNTSAVVPLLEHLVHPSQPQTIRLRAFWTQHVCGLLQESDYLERTKDDNQYVRSWAVQFLAEQPETITQRTKNRFLEMAQAEDSLIVRRYLTSALQRLPIEDRRELVAAFVQDSQAKTDRNLPLLTWFGLEPFVAKHPQEAVALVESVQWPQVVNFTHRRAAVMPVGREALLNRLVNAESSEDFVAKGREFLAAIESQGRVQMPENWAKVRQAQAASASKQAEELVLRIGARLGDAETFPHWRAIVENKKNPPQKRRDALELLNLGRDPMLGQIATKLLSETQFQQVALKVLPGNVDEQATEALIEQLPNLPLDLRNDAVNLLVTRTPSARQLLQAIEEKRVESSLLSPVLVRQMIQLPDESIQASIQSIWGTLNETPENLDQQKNRWKRVLTPLRLSRADRKQGRFLFQKSCGTCHRLFGEGPTIGPDLTGSNRANVDYLLENILAPNAVIGKAYQMSLFMLDDGRVLGGLIRQEDENAIQLVLPGGTELTINQDQIEERMLSNQSIMPVGMFEKMTEKEVLALIAYLGSKRQVPLPPEATQQAEAKESQ